VELDTDNDDSVSRFSVRNMAYGQDLFSVTDSGYVQVQAASATAPVVAEILSRVAATPNSDCRMTLGDVDGIRGSLRVGRDANGTAADRRAGVLQLQDETGGWWYLWVQRNGTQGKLRMSLTADTDPGTDDGAGEKVADQ
jgi:hypothetical protein